jgi:lysophospholipase L1-like esterase
MSSIDAFSVMVNNTSKRKATKGMVILFQGDSITDGNRGRNNDPNHIMGHGYAFSIASRLGADYPELDLNFYNRGISGNKIIDLADRWQTDTLNLKPVVLSILIGVNDASSVVMNQEPLVPVEKYEEVYRTLLTETHKTLPDCIVVLCGPFILKTGNVANHWDAYVYDVKQRQAVVRKLADEFAAVFVDFQDVFNEACIKAPAEYWIWDGVHPTVPGHELMAREWIKQIEKILSF